MKSLEINFASQLAMRHRARLSLDAAVFCVLGLVLAGLCSWQVVSNELERASVQAEIQVIRHHAGAQPRKPSAAAPLTREEIAGVNQAIRQLNLPWPAIFDAVERATTDTLAVLSLTPDSNSQTVAITAESQTTDAMLDYVRELKAQPLFDQVAITRHEVNEKDPHKPVRFEVAAHWKLAR